MEEETIKQKTGEVLENMTINGFAIDVRIAMEPKDDTGKPAKISPFSMDGDIFSTEGGEGAKGGEKKQEESQNREPIPTIHIHITLDEPRFLIGQGGQTLFDLQRILRLMLHKALQKHFYVDLDINDYKKRKLEYLKQLALDAAEEVSFKKEKKFLSPMPSYERRIIHMELANRHDVSTESWGEGRDRCVAINPK